MLRHWRVCRWSLIAVLALNVAAPFPGWSAMVSLGTARGVRAVEVSLDGEKTWLSLGGYSLPVVDDARLRSTTGSAVIDLADGSRVILLPFSGASFREAGSTVEISLRYGRLTFKLPQRTRVALLTQAARLDPVRTDLMVGELLVDGTGTVGVKMTRGQLHVTELPERREVRLASVEPVFLPRPPAATVPFASADSPSRPTGGRALFSPRGESLGYLTSEGQLVLQPGYTSDLSRPFPPKVVEAAMARVQAQDRPSATPVFDLSGGYAGYVAGPVFYAQAELPRSATSATTSEQPRPGEGRSKVCAFPSPSPSDPDVWDGDGRYRGYYSVSRGRLVAFTGGDRAPMAPNIVQAATAAGPDLRAVPLFNPPRLVGYLLGSRFQVPGGPWTDVVRPVHCAYYALGGALVPAAAFGLYEIAKNGVDATLEVGGNSPFKPVTTTSPTKVPVFP